MKKKQVVLWGMLPLIMLLIIVSALIVWPMDRAGQTYAASGSNLNNPLASVQPLNHMTITTVLPISPKDIWIAGGYQVSAPSTCERPTREDPPCPRPDTSYQVYFQHYDGKKWNVVERQYNDHDATIEDMTAVSAKEVYAVGSYRSDPYSENNQQVLEKWDGGHWEVIDLPLPEGALQSKLHAVLALSSRNIWAVGDYINQHHMSHALIYQWNGKTWKLFSAPSSFSTLSSIQRIGSTQNVVAKGVNFDRPQMLILSDL